MTADALARAEADRRAGRLEEAVARFRAVLAADSGNGRALTGLFAALDSLGRAGTPAEAVARTNWGDALRRQGRLDEAEAAHRASAVWLPGFGGSRFNLGVVLQARGRLAEAADAYAEAARLMPDFAPAACNAGAVLRELGRTAEAEAHLRQAVGIDPGFVAARVNLGAALRERGSLREAAAQFRAAAALAPHLAEAHANLGLTVKEDGDAAASIPPLRRALALGLADPGGVLAQLVQQMRHLCRWEGLEALSARLRELVRSGATRQAHPWIFLGEGAGPAAERACAERYAAWRAAAVGPLPEARAGNAGRRLRIGYLSADFHEHATAVLIAELIERHDRMRVEVVGCSYGPDDGGAMRARLLRAFDRHLELRMLSHAEAARAIRDAGIDILVDLKGHTQGARPEIAAARPAPVQAQWLGYPGTMGARWIDYAIVDSVTAPPEHAAHWSEALVRLPGCYQPNDRRRAIAADAPTRTALGLPEGAFVFCCFNAPYKINPALFDRWMRILARVPDSALWLLEGQGEASGNLRREAAARGIDPARLVFAPKRPIAEHLARHRAADLFLDTWPVGAHTTASDALWAGLPVLTMLGDAFAGRVGASLLRAVGLPELVSPSPDAYEAEAVRLAEDRAGLAALRARLAATRATAPLFDADRFARSLEAAYKHMWDAHRAGRHPESFDVSEG